MDAVDRARLRERRQVEQRHLILFGEAAESVGESPRLQLSVRGVVLPHTEWAERRRYQHEHLGWLAVGPSIACSRDLGERHGAARGVLRREPTRYEQVVRAEPDHHQVKRSMGLQHDRKVSHAVAARFERILEHRRSAVQTFLDDVDVVAELTLHHAGPPAPSLQTILGGGLVAPGVGIAVAADRGHSASSMRSITTSSAGRSCAAVGAFEMCSTTS